MAETDGVDGWRVLGGGMSAWFEAPPPSVPSPSEPLAGEPSPSTSPARAEPRGGQSLGVGATLAGRIVELVGDRETPDLDLRGGGVRVRIGVPGSGAGDADLALAGEISGAARELGLVADPAGLQELGVAVSSIDLLPVASFWSTAFGYVPVGGDRFGDPLRRDSGISFYRLEQPRPLRNRIHVDVSRTADAVEAFRTAVGQEPYGPWGVALADPDGNEIDLVPGSDLADGPETADWRVLFGAMTFYPTTSPAQVIRLATAVARLADEAGRPLLVDLRPDGITIDSGKDQWENDIAGFVELAARIQSAARDLGLSADLGRLRFVQFGMDAVDVPAVRGFWTHVLGYQEDPRGNDIYDPRRLNPTFIFQQMDAAEADRRRQRNRTHLELSIPSDQVQARLDAAIAAGGRILPTDRPSTHTVADPEGNELDLVTD